MFHIFFVKFFFFKKKQIWGWHETIEMLLSDIVKISMTSRKSSKQLEMIFRDVENLKMTILDRK